MHHHHNDVMTTTPPSDLKILGIVSSQTQRQAGLTSRSSQGLMQWPSAVGSIISSCCSKKQTPSAVKSIKCKHLCREEKLTSAISHQEEGSSLTMVIRHQREVECHLRAEEYQSVIILDYTFLTNPHLSFQMTSVECCHDISKRVSSTRVQYHHHQGYMEHIRASFP